MKKAFRSGWKGRRALRSIEAMLAAVTVHKAAKEEKTDMNTEITNENSSMNTVRNSENSAERVLRYFEKIAAVPHGSYHTDEISGFLVNFADERGLKVRKDKANNVVIFKEASGGRENEEPLILQSHMDMVLEKDSGVETDMEKEPVTLVREGNILRARGTTLGADDGIGAAMMLSILDDDSLSHPELECIFTSDEEVGMLGCEALDCSDIRGRKLINLDSESEGIFTAGCAGGAEVALVLPVERKEKDGSLVRIHVSGLKGGHSGAQIAEGRANAVQILGRALTLLYESEHFRLVSADGGNKDNAIPREAEAVLLFDEETLLDKVSRHIGELGDKLREEYAVTDPGISVGAELIRGAGRNVPAMRKKDGLKVMQFLSVFPNGVQEFSPSFPGLPQTSLNLGILKTGDDALCATFLVRSSINSQKEMMVYRLKSLAALCGAAASVSGEYPAWEYNRDSAFRENLIRVYGSVTGREAKVELTHGGLECGLLSGKIDGLDSVSIGPDMWDVHTPRERVDLDSVGRVYDFLRAVIAECGR